MSDELRVLSVLQSLNELFLAYCNYGTRTKTTELDGAKFVKIFKDTGLVGKSLIATDLDIIYSKVINSAQYHHLFTINSLSAEDKCPDQHGCQ